MGKLNKNNFKNFYTDIANESKNFDYSKPGHMIDTVIEIGKMLAIKHNLKIEQFNIRYHLENNLFDLFIGFKDLDEVVHLTMEGK